ncbi:MAG: PKD domain-containing protein [bacterium]|nr:PKD domain-containing protein [bacterium]
MKDAFENNLKQSLENFEMPYDSAAWNAMQARLDATASTPSFEDKMKEGLNANEYPYNPAAWSAMSKRLDKGGQGGFKKWYYAAAILGAAAITTTLLWNYDSNNEKSSQPTAQVEQNQTASNKPKNNASNSSTNVSSNKMVHNGSAGASNGTNEGSSSNITESNNGTHNSIEGNVNSLNSGELNQGNSSNTSNTQASNNTANNNGGNGTVVPTNTTPNESAAWKFIAPVLPETMCEGSAIQIQNDNEYPIVIVYPNGLNWVGRENQVTKLNPSVAGTYKIGYLRNNRFKEKTTFVVHELPTADMDFVDLSQKYLNGLPTIEVRSTSDAESYLWEYENGTVEGEQVGLHFYDAGLRMVRLTVTNENGCSQTVEKPVNVTEDYNLMAMNAFYPTGNDRTTNTFMPYALTERNVDFKLIIVDPNDGHTLFETSDASEGWDGIDQRSGSLVPLEKSYIWKVTIMNPERGEDNVYAGTVLTLPQ